MRLMKAFGISCGIVLGTGILVAALTVIGTWQPWLLYVNLGVIVLVVMTLLIREIR